MPFSLRGAWRHSLGEILVAQGTLTRDKLLGAIDACRPRPSQLLGERLVALGFVTQVQLDAALDEQRRRRGMSLEYVGRARCLTVKATEGLARLTSKLDELAELARS